MPSSRRRRPLRGPVIDLTSAVWHLRLARAGNTFTASYSADGQD